MPLFNRLTRRPIIYGLDLFSFNHDRLIIFFYVWKKFSNESRKKWIRLQQVQDAIQQGPTEAWTRIIGFRFRSANHCTIRPYTASGTPSWTLKPSQCKNVFLIDSDRISLPLRLPIKLFGYNFKCQNIENEMNLLIINKCCWITEAH